MPGYTFFPLHPALADVAEAIWDTDFPAAETARSIVLPVVSPILCFHYRSPPALCFRYCPPPAANEWIDSSRYRMTGVQSHAARLRPSGPVGGVMVRLKPEAAPRIAGIAMDELYDAAFPLGDVFGPTEVSLLDEMLAEAPDATARVTAVQAFLLRRLQDDGPDPLVCHAALRLRREPTLSVRHLASHLDISERHLSRRFRAMIGATPKQFARIVRIGKVVATARQHQTGWADIAQSCGFNDQAHMIKDFSAMVGSSPEAFFRATSLGGGRRPSASLAESDFYNTFLVEGRSSEGSQLD